MFSGDPYLHNGTDEAESLGGCMVDLVCSPTRTLRDEFCLFRTSFLL